ncbi:hypothetical protein GBF38_019969 [Nibea albiflora]|uniref:Uncharacterized protein n=1 Tax=Nibea albiflora TaxID=240163 RepID=A0ACB7FCV4_NIBAL|nr:hypothetical protein GBF38_019969 [Nibea albiflora]
MPVSLTHKERPLEPEMLTKVKTWLKEAMETSPPNSTTEQTQKAKHRGPSTQSLRRAVLLSSISEALEGDNRRARTVIREPVIFHVERVAYDWWKHNSHRFTRLSALARQNSCPHSSMASQRVFRTIGNIYGDRQSSLKGKNAEKLCFLYYNQPLLDWSY